MAGRCEKNQPMESATRRRDKRNTRGNLLARRTKTFDTQSPLQSTGPQVRQTQNENGRSAVCSRLSPCSRARCTPPSSLQRTKRKSAALACTRRGRKPIPQWESLRQPLLFPNPARPTCTGKRKTRCQTEGREGNRAVSTLRWCAKTLFLETANRVGRQTTNRAH